MEGIAGRGGRSRGSPTFLTDNSELSLTAGEGEVQRELDTDSAFPRSLAYQSRSMNLPPPPLSRTVTRHRDRFLVLFAIFGYTFKMKLNKLQSSEFWLHEILI